MLQITLSSVRILSSIYGHIGDLILHKSAVIHRSVDSANRQENRSKIVKDLELHTLTNIVNIKRIRGRMAISFIKISVCLLPLCFELDIPF